MKKLTLLNTKMAEINMKKIFIAFVNGEATVIYKDKANTYDLVNNVLLTDKDVVKYEEPFNRYLHITKNETSENIIHFVYDGDLYQEKIRRFSKVRI